MGMIAEKSSSEERDIKAEERRRQILDAAAAMLAQKGYHGMTMDDIVSKSGLSKGTLYWYFKSKKEIILAIMSRHLEEAKIRTYSSLEGVNTFSEQIQVILNDMVNMHECAPNEDSRNRQIQLTTEFWRQAAVDPEVNAKMSATYEWQTELGQKLVRAAVARGEICEVDATALSDVLIAMLDGLSLRWLLNPNGVDLVRSAQALHKMMFKGLGK